MTTNINEPEDTLTREKMEEAIALITALVPKEAPFDSFCVLGRSGLRIMRGEHISADTIIVSKDLYDIIYNASVEEDV